MEVSLKEITEEFKEIKVKVDEEKLTIIKKFLAHCVRYRILKPHSPQMFQILREAIEFSRKEESSG